MAGMRRGEILWYRWKDVDLDVTRISVHQALVSIAYEVPVSTPKTHQVPVIGLTRYSAIATPAGNDDIGTVGQLRANRIRVHNRHAPTVRSGVAIALGRVDR